MTRNIPKLRDSVDNQVIYSSGQFIVYFLYNNNL